MKGLDAAAIDRASTEAREPAPSSALLAAEIAEAERRERTRLAEALHDDALQQLLAARQELSEARTGDPVAFERLTALLDSATSAIRRVTHANHEESLAALPLADALQRVCADAGARGRFAAAVRVDPDTGGPHDAVLLAIVRELLANVARHARASAADISVLRRGADVVVRVVDNGRGIDPHRLVEAAGRGHLGHARLRDQAELLGGSVTIGPGDTGDGTAVTVRVPVARLRDQGTLQKVLRTQELPREQEHAATRRTAVRLGRLLDVSRQATTPADIDAVLREVAVTMYGGLGWGSAINVYRPEWDDYVVRVVHRGGEELLGEVYPKDSWSPVLIERYERRGAYMIPEEQAPAPDKLRGPFHVPDLTPLDRPDAWRAEDMLYIPVVAADGRQLALISLDEPASGLRPRDAELDVLVAIADHAAVAIEHARELAEEHARRRGFDGLASLCASVAGIPHNADGLAHVAAAIAEPLGFRRSVIEIADPTTGRLGDPKALATNFGWGDRRPPHTPVAIAELEEALSPVRAGTEGCVLLNTQECFELLPPSRLPLARSLLNGRGPQAWVNHSLFAPLRDGQGKLIGYAWVGDPEDRLRPSVDRLRVLRAAADLATLSLR